MYLPGAASRGSVTSPSQEETKRSSEEHEATGNKHGTAEVAILRGTEEPADKWILIRVLRRVGVGLKQNMGKWALTEEKRVNWRAESGK